MACDYARDEPGLEEFLLMVAKVVRAVPEVVVRVERLQPAAPGPERLALHKQSNGQAKASGRYGLE